jgi:hypothetical protein
MGSEHPGPHRPGRGAHDHDLLAGEDLGTFRYYENTGDALSPKFAERTGAANPLNGRDVGDEAKPTFGDLDGDGDLDLLSGRLSQSFSYFQNTGTARTPAFAAPLTNPFGLSLVGLNVAPVLGDLDGDGDLDVAFGGYYDELRFFENTGTRIAPAFVLRLDEDDPFDDLDPSYYATPTLGDFDSDGDLDVVHGREHGRLSFIDHFRPIDSLLEDALFLETSGDASPANGIDVGDRSAPAAADLNADGTPDLVTGNLAGTFAVHFLPEPDQGAMLGAGLALLGWLRRLGRSRSAR